MAEPILFDVKIETAKATADYKKFTEVVKQGGADAAKSITTTASAAESSAKKTTAATAALAGSAQTMGQKFAGAGGAISGANAALQLMGRQGPPALQTLASAAAAVAVSGFGPMTLAITGAVTVLSLLASTSDAATESLNRQESQVASLASQAIVARQQLEALQLGVGLGEFQIDEQIAVAEERFRAARRNLAEAEAKLAADRKLVPPAIPGFEGPIERGEKLVGATRAELGDREAELRLLESIRDSRNRQREIREAEAERRKADAEQQAREREIEQSARQRRDRIRAAEDRAIAERAAEQRKNQTLGFQLQSLRTGENVGDLELQAEIERRQRLSFPDSSRRDRENKVVIETLQERLALTRELREETERISKAEENDRFFRSFGEKGAASITGALSQALQTGDLDGFFDSFQAAMSSTFADALASALIQKPLENALGGITSSIGSNAGGLFGLLSDPTSPGVRTNPTGPPVPPITVIDVNGGADAIAAGLSKQGKRAIVQEGLIV